jgi:hypothetical protein
MIATFKLMSSCEALNLLQPFDGTCFGHVMSKAVQYATNDNKIFKDLAPISVKSTQKSLQPCIIDQKNQVC